jgi:hypothetical protein
LTGVSADSDWLDLSFGPDISIRLDRHNRYALEGEVAEVKTPDGRIWDLQADGTVFLSEPA